MGMLDRYKKKGGFYQLLVLIETSGNKKQEQFLTLIQQESPAWEKELKSKILTVERVFSWPAEVMFEVLTRIQPLTLCATLHGRAQEEIDRILMPLPPITKRKLIDQLSELKPNAGEKFSSEMKLLSEVRGIVASGYIKFEKFDVDLYIDEDIEEHLNGLESETVILKTEVAKTTADSHHPATPPASSGAAAKSGGGDHTSPQATAEVESLKKKLTLLVQENSTLKQENQVLKDKLTQIRKIA